MIYRFNGKHAKQRPARFARKRELIRIDPTMDMEKVSVSAKPREILSTDEISRLFSLDGLKSPKNGELREVPLLPAIRDELRADLAAFERVKSERMRRRDRGVTFRQCRHVYTSRGRDKVDLPAVQLATGHKTAKLAEELYGSHTTAQHFAGVAAAGAEVFGETIPFPE
ncbi:MAG: hypothetical protein ACLFM0_10565 [Spirochaetales bacterium]